MDRSVTLTSVLASTMAASNFMLLVFGIFADELIAEFGVERWQVGVLVTASSGISAVGSPIVGRIADHVGARRMTVLTLCAASAALAAVALSPDYAFLLAAAASTALAQAMANPATNKVIGEHVPPGSRGLVTGLKQSGVQVGVFLGGMTLPAIAAATDWRVAVLVFAGAWLGFAVFGALMLPADAEAPQAGEARTTPHGGLPPVVRRVAVYGFLLGAGGTGVFTYLPLYAQEALGLGDAAAGAAVALTGFVGIAARIGWGRAAEHCLGSISALRRMAALAVLAAMLLLSAGFVSDLLLWPGAILAGASVSAWNSVGNLTIIQNLPARDTGRATGVMMFGFLAGLAVGSPLFGWSVDLTGSYVLGWSGAALLFALGLLALDGTAAAAHVPADADASAPKPG